MLSPTPSLSDLVHFFSNNDELGMGLEFSNADVMPVPCPPTSTVETNVSQISQQVQPPPSNTHYKRKKKSRHRKPVKTGTDQKIEDSFTYRSMKPSLEEVEEQLFVSFTSKVKLRQVKICFFP